VSERRSWCQKGGVGARKEELVPERSSERSCCQKRICCQKGVVARQEELSDRRGYAERSLSESQKGVVARKGNVVRQEELLSRSLSCCQYVHSCQFVVRNTEKCRKELMRKEFVGKELLSEMICCQKGVVVRRRCFVFIKIVVRWH